MVCLTVWTTGARCTVIKMTHSSGREGTKTTSVTIAKRRFTGYKYLIRLVLTTISQFFFLSHLGVTFLTLCLQSMEDKRGTKRARSPSKEGSPSPSDAKTPPLAPFGSPPPLTSPSKVSSRCPVHWCESKGDPPGRL
jgi:hypothetical protein